MGFLEKMKIEDGISCTLFSERKEGIKDERKEKCFSRRTSLKKNVSQETHGFSRSKCSTFHAAFQ